MKPDVMWCEFLMLWVNLGISPDTTSVKMNDQDLRFVWWPKVHPPVLVQLDLRKLFRWTLNIHTPVCCTLYLKISDLHLTNSSTPIQCDSVVWIKHFNSRWILERGHDALWQQLVSYLQEQNWFDTQIKLKIWYVSLQKLPSLWCYSFNTTPLRFHNKIPSSILQLNKYLTQANGSSWPRHLTQFNLKIINHSNHIDDNVFIHF